MHHSELLSRRRKLELSQAALAARLGVTANTVARWERGEMAISPLLRLALQHLALEMEEERAAMTPEERFAHESARHDRLRRGEPI